jgi:hypothetical protein
MNIAQRALEISFGELGHGEEGKNNCGPYIEKYLNGLAEPPANWCAGFVSWCYLKAVEKEPMPFGYSLSARAIYNEFKRKKWLVKKPQPGDLIFFWRESIDSWMGHIGFVLSDFIKSENRIDTIEGNKGRFPAMVVVFEYQLPIPQLLAYGRIK